MTDRAAVFGRERARVGLGARRRCHAPPRIPAHRTRGVTVYGLLGALLLALCPATPCAADESRGLQRVRIGDSGGQEVEFYKGSYALLVGVSDYTAGWPDLESVPGELDRVQRILEEKGYTVIRHDDPDSESLIDAFRSFIDEYGFDSRNRLLFFFSGHGYTRDDGRKGYLVPADAPNPERDEREFLRKSLGMSQILAWARKIEAKHALFLFDSCFSGTVFKARALPEQPPHISRLTAKPVRQFITAGSAGEEVPANSVFTPAFVDALEHGLGDLDKDGYMTGTELGLYLQSTVPKHTRQTPQFGKISDYELARGDYVFLVGLHPSTTTDAPPSPGPAPGPPPAPSPRLGHLQVSVNVASAQIYLNGNRSGSASPGVPLNLENLPAGSGQLEARADGYRSASKRIEVRENGWTQVLLSLVPDSVPDPPGPAGPVDPALVGIWEQWVTIGQGKSRWQFSVHADGTYDFSSTGVGATRHSGSFTTSGNHWIMKSDTITWNDGGTYHLPSSDTFVMTGALGTGVWQRVSR